MNQVPLLLPFPLAVTGESGCVLRQAAQIMPLDWEQYLPTGSENWCSKRKWDWCAGRYCAQSALELAGRNTPFSLPGDRDRVPVWPVGFTGSITHTAGFVGALLRPETDGYLLGVDAEGIMDKNRAAKVEKMIFVPGERKRLQGQTSYADGEIAAIVFSAKESVFKAVFPPLRRWFGFDAVDFFDADLKNGRLSGRICVDLAPVFLPGDTVMVYFALDGGLVHTICRVRYQGGDCGRKKTEGH